MEPTRSQPGLYAPSATRLIVAPLMPEGTPRVPATLISTTFPAGPSGPGSTG